MLENAHFSIQSDLGMLLDVQEEKSLIECHQECLRMLENVHFLSQSDLGMLLEVQ
jgi:hypothetical protein